MQSIFQFLTTLSGKLKNRYHGSEPGYYYIRSMCCFSDRIIFVTDSLIYLQYQPPTLMDRLMHLLHIYPMLLFLPYVAICYIGAYFINLIFPDVESYLLDG